MNQNADLIVTLRYTDMLEEQLSYCQEIGINNFRINFARSSYEKNKQVIETVNKKINNVNIFLDLPGYKIRIDSMTEGVYVKEGTEIFLGVSNKKCKVLLPFYNFNKVSYLFKINDNIVFGDNDLRCLVKHIDKNYMILYSLNAGYIKSRSGIVNISSYYPNETILGKEIELIKSFDDKNIYWEISFADMVSRINACKKYIKHGKIIAKIESSFGVKNIKSIVPCVDGIMLARGDLSNFYTDIEINKSLFNLFSVMTKNNNKIYIAASNYFKSLAENGKLNKKDYNCLNNIINQVDYVITNETSYSENWEKIIYEFEKIKSRCCL